MHANIEITRNCNQKCFYCFNDSGSLHKETELGLSEWKTILSNLHSFGCKSILVTGGEPFMHPDIIKIIEHSIGIGLETSILSNGFHVSTLVEKHQDLFSKLQLAQISLDAMEPAIHNARRGCHEAYKIAIDAINSLRKINVLVEISMVVSDENILQVYDVAKYCKKINSSLIVRPIIKGGRAELLNPVEGFYERLIEIKDELMFFYGVNIIKDRFCYVSDDNLLLPIEKKQQVIIVGPDGKVKKTPSKGKKIGGLLNLLNAA